MLSVLCWLVVIVGRVRSESVLERFFGVKGRVFNWMERITGRISCRRVHLARPGRGHGVQGVGGPGVERLRRRLRDWGTILPGVRGLQFPDDGAEQGRVVDEEAEEGAGVASVFEGVEGGPALALGGLGAERFGGEEGGPEFAFALGHEPVSGEGL